MQWFYYLHSNGDIIGKKFRPDVSDFVQKVWEIDTNDRADAYIFLLDAAAMGAMPDRVRDMRGMFGMTETDCQVFADRLKIKIDLDGDMWCAMPSDFTNLAEKPAGFGKTKWDALVDLCRKEKGEPTDRFNG